VELLEEPEEIPWLAALLPMEVLLLQQQPEAVVALLQVQAAIYF
jgi:hypothetical protein